MKQNHLLDDRSPGSERQFGLLVAGVVTRPPERAAPATVSAEPWVAGGRYCDRPTSWSARLFGIVGTAMFGALVLVAFFFTWRVVHRPVTSSSQPLVIELRPLAAPPDPMRDVAPGLKRVEKQETKPLTEHETPPVSLIQLPAPSSAKMEVRQPAEIVDPGRPVPETTAPESIVAPPANRMASDARPNWEGVILAHLERFRRYPARARAAGQQGTIYLRFRMSRAGTVLSASIQRGSGFYALDQAALDTLKRAQPLPTIPTDRPDEIEFSVPVEFYIR